MSYFFRQLFHFVKWDESQVKRGKTTPESNDGSFAPRGEGRPAGDKGTPGPGKQGGMMNIPAVVSHALSQVAEFCKRHSGVTPALRQPGIGRNDKAGLIAQAQESKPLYDTWARGVASVFNAQVFDRVVDGVGPPEQAIAYAKENPQAFTLILAGIKGDPRLSEKARIDYNGDFSMVKDMVRGTISVPDASRLDDVLDVLESAGLRLAAVPKDRINSPGPDGYRDVKLNVFMPNGHIAEIQVMTHAMLEAKQILGHKLQEEVRPLLAELEKGARAPTPEERAFIVNNQQRQNEEVYTPAWRRSLVPVEHSQ